MREQAWNEHLLDFLNSKVYRVIELLTNLIVLNLMWLVLCIPVITAFPATAAMFGVIREWIKGADSGSAEPFIRHLKANFVQSLGLGVLWLVLGSILILDFILIREAVFWIQLPLFLVLVLAGLGYLITSVYLFPVMVNYQNRWQDVIKNSFLIGVSQLGITLLCLLIGVLMLVILLYLPIALLLVGSSTAYVVYLLCNRAFHRIEMLKGIKPESAEEVVSG